MNTDENRVGYVGPKRCVLHGDIACAAHKPFPGSVHRGTIIGIAAEHAIEKYIIAGKDVHSVAPAVVTDSLHISDSNRVRAARSTLGGEQSVDEYICGISDFYSHLYRMLHHPAADYFYITGIPDG